MSREDVPDGFLLTEDDLEEITKEDLDNLEEIVDEYIELQKEFNKEVDDVLRRINESKVYKELGKEIHISTEYYYDIKDR